jgi:hypothetical protein
MPCSRDLLDKVCGSEVDVRLSLVFLTCMYVRVHEAHLEVATEERNTAPNQGLSIDRRSFCLCWMKASLPSLRGTFVPTASLQAT